jgi:predicted aldo/keto reductase-like oxidoreductase
MFGKVIPMQFRAFPKIPDLAISSLGFGCMRLPTIGNSPAAIDEELATRLIDQAIDSGVNLFDTAWPYHGEQSEPFLGRAIKRRRERVLLSTKLPVWSVKKESDWEHLLDQQLRKLDTSHLDFYLLHALSAGPWDKVKSLRGLQALARAKADGRVKHIGFSFHGPFDEFRTIVDGYDWELCLIQLNYVDQHFQAGLRGLAHAAQRKVGVVVMEPLRGGALAKVPPEVQAIWSRSKRGWSAAEWALRWALDQAGVVSVISGMNAEAQLTENLRVANTPVPLEPQDHDLANEAARFFHERMAVPCTTCGYCVPCPSGVAIPDVFSSYNTAFMFDDLRRPRFEYKAFVMGAGGGADRCTECGECEPKCPQNIAISATLAKAHAHLAAG